MDIYIPNEDEKNWNSKYLINPREHEIERWMLSTLNHSLRYEYYETIFKFRDENDSETPHDMGGKYNKFDWQVLRRMAMQYREDPFGFYHLLVKEGINLHRKQKHHDSWNNNRPRFENQMYGGAQDAILVYRDGDRPYNGDSHLLKNVRVAMFNSGRTKPFQEKPIDFVYNLMIKEKEPDLSNVSLNLIPSLNLSVQMHNKILNRVNETLKMLRKKGYDL